MGSGLAVAAAFSGGPRQRRESGSDNAEAAVFGRDYELGLDDVEESQFGLGDELGHDVEAPLLGVGDGLGGLSGRPPLHRHQNPWGTGSSLPSVFTS